jgi:sugar lactone lactonase YvrE
VDGPATDAVIGLPRSVFVDSVGNIFFSDAVLNRVLMIDTLGILREVAGDGFQGFAGDGFDASRASFDRPAGIFVDRNGDVYVADRGNNRVRRMDAETRIVDTVAGSGGTLFDGDGALATIANLDSPAGVFVDRNQNLFIADRDHNRIRRVNAQTRRMTTVAGRESAGNVGDGGPATEAYLNRPISVVMDLEGNLYISDEGNLRVRKVDVDGIITTVAGAAVRYDFLGAAIGGFGGDGGPATLALFNNMKDIFVDAGGNIYICDENNNRVRRVDPKAIITTVAGDGWVDTDGGGRYTTDDVPATESSLNDPKGVFVDRSGNLIIADEDNNRIRMVVGIAAPTDVFAVSIPSADFNGDGSVAFEDFLLFAGVFGLRSIDPPYDSKFDLDSSGEIGFGDFLLFAGQFGK